MHATILHPTEPKSSEGYIFTIPRYPGYISDMYLCDIESPFESIDVLMPDNQIVYSVSYRTFKSINEVDGNKIPLVPAYKSGIPNSPGFSHLLPVQLKLRVTQSQVSSPCIIVMWK